MIQNDEQLLLADLCARLPYKTFAQWHHNALNKFRDVKIMKISTYGKNIDDYYINVLCQPEPGVDYEASIVDIKPYLRPMSSMTEEEKDEMFGICTLSDCSVNTDWEFVGVEIMSSHPRYGDHYSTDYKVIDWLNKNMFDYRGLIKKGLALEAPEGMYGKEEQQ
jgi:hypothetical protein